MPDKLPQPQDYDPDTYAEKLLDYLVEHPLAPGEAIAMTVDENGNPRAEVTPAEAIPKNLNESARYLGITAQQLIDAIDAGDFPNIDKQETTAAESPQIIFVTIPTEDLECWRLSRQGKGDTPSR